MAETTRTIMIFPAFPDIRYIEEIRKEYDPLYGKIRPHITLVFPFESCIETDALQAILGRCLNMQKPFALTARGVLASDRWLLLDIPTGRDTLIGMHERLYGDAFAEYRPGWLGEYRPHITLGRFASAEQAKEAQAGLRGFDREFRCRVDTVSVEIIGENEESIIELEYHLQ